MAQGSGLEGVWMDLRPVGEVFTCMSIRPVG
jgi:hypothetical protein